MELNTVKNFIVNFFEEHLIMGWILIGVLCMVLFLGSIEAGQNIGDAIWGQ